MLYLGVLLQKRNPGAEDGLPGQVSTCAIKLTGETLVLSEFQCDCAAFSTITANSTEIPS